MMRLVLAAVVALCLSACTLTDESIDGIKSPREKALHNAVQEYADAYLAGDGPGSRQFLAPECEGKVDAARWDEMASRMRRDYAAAEMVGYDARIWEGDRADVSYDFGEVPFKKANERWVWDRDAGWLNAGC